LQKHLRLRQGDDFRRVRDKGTSFKQSAFILGAVRNDLPHNRYGIIVSKRLGKAVVRNRLRRVIREALRSIHAQLPTGYDVVVVARHPGLKLNYRGWQQALLGVMQRLNP
jgi:ribonuclease P protein component